MVWKILLEILFVILAFPVGFLISKFTEDEFADGKKWFFLLAIISAVLGILFFFAGQKPIYLTLLFMMIVSGVSYYRSRQQNLNNSKTKRVHE